MNPAPPVAPLPRDHASLLPIGVVLPTLNARAVLPDHLAELRTWAGSVPEIIVVDSHSDDGTIAFIQDQLHHPGLRIFQRPRGLYEAWNFGVEQVTADFTYISTAGDTITLSGLRHLLETAQSFRSDVVVSPPLFQKPDGEIMDRKHWRIHQYLEARALTQPALIPQSHVFLTAVFAGLSGLMGSSASNLYRTSVLKARPFPTDFGHNGDTARGPETRDCAARGGSLPANHRRVRAFARAGAVGRPCLLRVPPAALSLVPPSRPLAREAGA
jgi:hypothetical protein